MAASGLYALVSLGDAPLDPRDVAVLDLGDPVAPYHRRRDGIMAQAVDREESGRAIDIAETVTGFTILLGYLDEAAELADRLGMASDTPSAILAAAALAAFDADAPRRMIGEWSLLDWHAPSRTLTLLMSETSRDPLYFAVDGDRVAISAEMNRLTRLGWVGRAFDPTGLLLHWGKARLRRYMTDETPFQRVRRLVPGSREVFGIKRRRTLRLPPLPFGEPWRGSFDEAMEAIEAVLRRIIRQHLGRYHGLASLLSGGLDSSLLAWLASVERRPEQPLLFLSSVAADGSGLADEREFSTAVADHLGLPIGFVTPAANAGFYIPEARMFAHSERPIASPRHYLYSALYQAAFDAGADTLFDGVYGELTITNKLPLKTLPLTPRYYIRAFRAWRTRRQMAADLPFHVRLAPDVIDALPSLISHDWQAPYDRNGRHDPWGMRVAAIKNVMTPTSLPVARLRRATPYRDRRLLSLVTTMPVSYMTHNGLNRAPARVMLHNRLPDQIRLRRHGMPFSPDYLLRATHQARATIERIDNFRAIGAGEWVDLKWLEAELKQLAVPGAATQERVMRAQATAVAAAYFEWLAGQ